MGMVIVAGLALLAPRAAQAQAPGAAGEARTWNVTPFVGVGAGGDLEGGSLALGVAGAYNWSSRVSFEGEFTGIPSASEGQLLQFDSNAWNLTGNVLYHFTERRFTPYVAGGLGIGHASADLAQFSQALALAGLSDSSTSLVLDFGGGVKHELTPRVNLRGDVRYFTGSDLVPDHLRFYAGLTFRVGGM